MKKKKKLKEIINDKEIKEKKNTPAQNTAPFLATRIKTRPHARTYPHKSQTITPDLTDKTDLRMVVMASLTSALREAKLRIGK